MIFKETITISEQEIVKRAIDLLAKHKQLIFKLEDYESSSPYDDSIIIVVSDLTLTSFLEHAAINISHDVFKDQRTSSEQKNICFNDVVALRIAKLLFDWHKMQEQKELADAVQDTLSGSSTAHTISAIKSGGITYDIGVAGKSLTTTVNEVDELKQKVKDLESEINLILQRLSDKGIL